MANYKECYQSITTKTYRIVLMHNDSDKELINQLEQRGYKGQKIDLVDDWFLEIHNDDKTLHTDRCGTFMFLFTYRCGVRLNALKTKDVLDNIDKLIDKPDKDYYFSLLISDKNTNKKHKKKKS